MPRTRALYSVVQYIPDGGRAEADNTGVVVYIPATRDIVVRTTPTLTRVRWFFDPKKRELRRIELALDAVKHRLESAKGEFVSEEDFRQFVAARADSMRLTTPRLVVLSDIVRKLDELYCELVGEEEVEHEERPRRPSFPSRVAEIFGRLEVAGKVWRPGTITVPETKRQLEVPVAFQNGRVNFVLPKSLARSDRPDGRLPKLGFNGYLIHQHKVDGRDSKLVVMSADPRASLDIESRYAEVLDDFHVRFVPFAESEKFATEVEQSAQ